MINKMPPLNALRAFEAVARSLSVRRAADELFVTPAAISHQLKTLEQYLNVKLVKLNKQKISLTPDGKNYAAYLNDAFKHIQTGTHQLLRNTRHNKTTLMISVQPTFALYWLIPRLGEFKQDYPHIELKISSSYELVDLTRSEFHLGIRVGRGVYRDLYSKLLFKSEVFPVCSPKIIQRKYPLNTPNNLRYYNLLSKRHLLTEVNHADWSQWLQVAKATDIDPTPAMIFESAFLSIQAAIDGVGVSLERGCIIDSALKEKSLIKPFNISLPELDMGHYFVCTHEEIKNPAVLSLQNWILKKIQEKSKK